MRVTIVIAALAAYTPFALAAPQVGGSGTCFDDGDCFLSGGSCVKSSGAITGTCSTTSSASSSAGFGIPTGFNEDSDLAPTKAASEIPTAVHKVVRTVHASEIADAAEVARRVATRTDLPSDVVQFARDVVARATYASAAASEIAERAVNTAAVSNISE